MRRRRLSVWAMLIAFVLVPLAEIYVIVQVGQVIGAWWTIVLLVVDSLIGAWLIRREGAKAWQALGDALSSGRMPARELADGGLILIAGTLMLTPGFLSDIVGILLILPLTRPLARGVLTRVVSRRLVLVGVPDVGRPGSGGPSGQSPSGRRPGAPGPVVQGEVVEEPDA